MYWSVSVSVRSQLQPPLVILVLRFIIYFAIPRRKVWK